MPDASFDDPPFGTSPSTANFQTYQTDVLLYHVATRGIEEKVITGCSGRARATKDALGGINVPEPQLRITMRIWHVGNDYSEEGQVF
ncbi:hypothetical protein PQX77_015469 [Marasmius sp. AFHP31]|nr:hypothetical protein PQX77_015469 [Marasmius sp. AFHP31]